MRSTSRRLASLALALLLFPAAACQASGEKEAAKKGKPEPYVPLPPEGPETIGYFLANFDRSLVQWSEYMLASSSSRDQNALRSLEVNMQERSRKRRDELVEVLENGSPVNRRIAAAALGFTHDPTVLGLLLASLSDPDPEVVQKALLAIGVLALPETPLGGILHCLRDDPDAWTRNNAAFALLAIARAGNTSDELLEGCRGALVDSEPGVRSQCASVLGVVAEPASVEPLAGLVFDESNLVALAAVTAMARIGRTHPESKGTAGRVLASALDQVRADRRIHLLGALRWLAGENFGEDAQPWLEWSHKLP